MDAPLPYAVKVGHSSPSVLWVIRCPSCGREAALSDDQFHGRVSMDHASQFADCTYHETVDFHRLILDLFGHHFDRGRSDAEFMDRLKTRVAEDADLLVRLAARPTPRQEGEDG